MRRKGGVYLRSQSREGNLIEKVHHENPKQTKGKRHNDGKEKLPQPEHGLLESASGASKTLKQSEGRTLGSWFRGMRMVGGRG